MKGHPMVRLLNNTIAERYLLLLIHSQSGQEFVKHPYLPRQLQGYYQIPTNREEVGLGKHSRTSVYAPWIMQQSQLVLGLRVKRKEIFLRQVEAKRKSLPNLPLHFIADLRGVSVSARLSYNIDVSNRRAPRRNQDNPP